MGLFNFQKNDKKKACCCNQDCNKEAMLNAVKVKNSGPSVKILGSGCAKCNQLEANTVEALKQLGMNTAVEHISDFPTIASYGVMTTPAIVMDGKVLSYGKVLKTEEIVNLIRSKEEN